MSVSAIQNSPGIMIVYLPSDFEGVVGLWAEESHQEPLPWGCLVREGGLRLEVSERRSVSEH